MFIRSTEAQPGAKSLPEIVAVADRLIWSNPDSVIILLNSLDQLPSDDQSGAAVISLALSKMYNAKRDCP
jgi:hypothetical protein